MDNKVIIPEKAESTFDLINGKENWYILIDSNDGTRISYDRKETKTRLRANILAGKHDQNSTAIIFTRRKPFFLPNKDRWNLITNWNQKATTLKEFMKKHFAVGVLYQPVWSHALAGLKWGAAIGIILKSIDSSIGFYQTDPFMAVLITLGILICFIPRYGTMSFFIFLFTVSQYPDTELILPIILLTALVGTALGCLPGMAVGGLIGWCRRRSLPRAHDAVSESRGVIVKAVLIPFLSGCAVMAVYIFVIFHMLLPWLYSMSKLLAEHG